jgi:serine/threonine protein kinase/Tol biopolymer transport system component
MREAGGDRARWQRIKQLVADAAARPSAERAQFLAGECPDDAAIREEVAALVASQEQASDFLERPPAVGSVLADIGYPAPARPPHFIAGQRVGPYEIVERIGAGGMGEVYRARDTRLHRDVALKVVRRDVAVDPARRMRLEREASAAAMLNHPAIVTVHSLEEHEGVLFVTMELVDGQTLAEIIPPSGLPLDRLLSISIDLADALSAAHSRGIVHRDLKPANVMVTCTGAVKVLDFGLSQIAVDEAAGRFTTETLTVDHALVGTVPYMAPEQLEGKPADRRSDIFSFGVMLFEMATGRRPFSGETPVATLTSILRDEAPLAGKLNPAVPNEVSRIINRCLTKDPDRRVQSAADLRNQLDDLWHMLESGAWVPAAFRHDAKSVPRVSKSRERISWMVAMLLVVIGLTTLYFGRPSTPQGSPAVARLTVALPAGVELATLELPAVALSPSGTQLAYAGISEGIQRLYLRSLDGLDSKVIPGTEGAFTPFFSPDGQWIGFFTVGKLKKVPVGGGPVEILCDATRGFGGSWGPDNNVYFVPRGISGLWKVSASGGTPTEVTRLDQSHGEISHRWPQLLPGGKAVLFTVWTGPGFDEQRIEAQSLQTGERHVLLRGGTNGRYFATGHLVYARADTLMAVRMDLDRLETLGDAPLVLAEHVRVGGEGAQYAVSDFGHLIYMAGDVKRYERQLVWVDRKGGVEAVPLPARSYSNVALSPDGRQAALEISEGTVGVWIYDFDRGTLARLTVGTSSSQLPLWTPDGRRVVYRGTRLGLRNLFWKSADGATQEERLTTEEGVSQAPTSWSPDGKWLVFQEGSAGTANDIWKLSLENNRKPQIVLQTPLEESQGVVSPDGRWLAYVSTESGRREIYIQPFSGAARKWPISTQGGDQPRWSRNGRELFYRSGDKMMAVDITTQPDFVAGSPHVLFEAPLFYASLNMTGYDVAPDGRFLGIRLVMPDPPANQINVVLNWQEELKQLAPAR